MLFMMNEPCDAVTLHIGLKAEVKLQNKVKYPFALYYQFLHYGQVYVNLRVIVLQCVCVYIYKLY